MRVGAFHLGYCTNVHPGESLEAIHAVLRRDVSAVKARVSPSGPFGTGLRLGNAAAERLAADEGARAALVALLEELDLYVFSVNGFPYGDFAAESVKAAVYEPGWGSSRRLGYTVALAGVLAELPGPTERTISTVAGGFGPHTMDDGARQQIAVGLGEAARALADLADRSGVAVRLCLEPEPWTTLETTGDVIDFWERYLHPLGAAAKAHLGLCYDCCHQAVHFEDAGASIRRLVEAAVPIGKVQVSSALHLADPSNAEGRRALLGFDEPRYLHQTVARAADGALLRALDLPDLIQPEEAWLGAEAWRTHFHVPVWWRGDGLLGTTRGEWEAALAAVQETQACTHLEVETYTWHVIPDLARFGGLHDCVAAELEAVRDVLASR